MAGVQEKDETDTEMTPCEDGGRNGSDAPPDEECQGNSGATRGQEEVRKDSPSSFRVRVAART